VEKVVADYVLISHGHGDHVADVVKIADRTGAAVIAPYEVGSWFEGKGVKNIQSLNHGGATKTDFGRVKLTAAIHSSSMPDGSYGGNPCGFVIESSDGNFYYSGDTALTMDMKLIGETTKLRFAVFPIGDFFTMGIEDALRAADFVSALRHLSSDHSGSRGRFKSRARRRDRATAPRYRREHRDSIIAAARACKYGPAIL
jgi:L-ascorbate metabolism protein UlaG (beta-lactamase superfamily)